MKISNSILSKELGLPLDIPMKLTLSCQSKLTPLKKLFSFDIQSLYFVFL